MGDVEQNFHKQKTNKNKQKKKKKNRNTLQSARSGGCADISSHPPGVFSPAGVGRCAGHGRAAVDGPPAAAAAAEGRGRQCDWR
jgi:hypothetical protein